MGRVAIFSAHFPPDIAVSSFRISAFVNTLTSAGHEVTVYTQRLEKPYKASFLDCLVQSAFVVRAQAKSKLGLFVFYLLQAIKISKSRTFSTVLMTGSPFYYFIFAPILRLGGISVLLDFRDPWALRPEFRYSKLKVCMEKIALSGATKAILVNEFVHSMYSQKYHGYKSKFFVIENGFFPKRMLSSVAPESMPLWRENSSIYLLYSGKLIYRNIEPLFAFLKKNPSYILIKFGPYEKVFDDLVNCFEISRQIKDFGLVEYKEVFWFLEHIVDINVVITSGFEWEASTKVFDALEARVPTVAIAPENSYVASVLRATEGGVAVPNEASMIGNMLEAILLHPPIMKSEVVKKYDRLLNSKRILKLVD